MAQKAMGLKDELAESSAVEQLPAKYKNHVEINGERGTAATGLVSEELIGSHDDMLRLAGLDPDMWQVDGKIHQWTKTRDGKPPLKSVFFAFRERTAHSDVTVKALAKLIKPVKPVKVTVQDGDPFVVCLADFQVGKTDMNGTTEDLLRRVEDVMGQAAAIAKADKPSHIILADLGDCIENITSTAPNQIATNDLTPDEQLRVWQRILTQAVLTFRQYTPKLTVVGVPSNHAEVRNVGGKVGQGDYGISTLGAVQDGFSLHDPDNTIEWVTPPTEYEIAATVETGGTQIAFFHGHHAKTQSNIEQWLAKQAASPGARLNPCTIAVHGHFHNFRYRRSTHGRELVSCPTMDNGSAYFYNATGEASPPGMVVFKIRDGRVYDLRCLEPA
jgi:hypothetical protein